MEDGLGRLLVARLYAGYSLEAALGRRGDPYSTASSFFRATPAWLAEILFDASPGFQDDSVVGSSEV